MMNIVTIHALRKTSSLPRPLRTLLLSLAVSDLGVGLLSQPLYIANLVQQLRHNFRKALDDSFYVVSGILYLSTSFSITALSADRFVAIQRPLRYQELVTYKRAVILVAAIWLFSAFVPPIGDFLLSINTFFAIFFTIQSVVFVATTWFSFKVYLTARRHNLQLQTQRQQVTQNSDMENITTDFENQPIAHFGFTSYF